MGLIPVKKLSDTLTCFRFGKPQRFAVTFPVRLFLATLKISKSVMLEMLEGSEPLRSL
jgi:hypothetical protein